MCFDLFRCLVWCCFYLGLNEIVGTVIDSYWKTVQAHRSVVSIIGSVINFVTKAHHRTARAAKWLTYVWVVKMALFNPFFNVLLFTHCSMTFLPANNTSLRDQNFVRLNWFHFSHKLVLLFKQPKMLSFITDMRKVKLMIFWCVLNDLMERIVGMHLYSRYLLMVVMRGRMMTQLA